MSMPIKSVLLAAAVAALFAAGVAHPAAAGAETVTEMGLVTNGDMSEYYAEFMYRWREQEKYLNSEEYRREVLKALREFFAKEKADRENPANIDLDGAQSVDDLMSIAMGAGFWKVMQQEMSKPDQKALLDLFEKAVDGDAAAGQAAKKKMAEALKSYLDKRKS